MRQGTYRHRTTSGGPQAIVRRLMLSTSKSTGFTRTACHECDLLITIDDMADGDRATCPRCGHTLATRTPDGLTRSLALAISAAMLLVASNLFPFLSLQASGLEQVMTLPRSAYELYLDGYWTIAVLVMGPIIGIPALMLVTIMSL